MRGLVLGVGVLGWMGFVACARVIAPAPPTATPAVERDTVLAGHPLAIAGKSARVLQDNQYLTRRFGKDSTWGYQSSDKISVRVRYRQRGDSTLVRLEGWGRCDAHGCVRGDIELLLAMIAQDEAAPQ